VFGLGTTVRRANTGFRVTTDRQPVYLGADTPVEVFADVAAEPAPRRIVVSFGDGSRARAFRAPFDASIVSGDPLAAAASI
jgi:hypothetical protein